MCKWRAAKGASISSWVVLIYLKKKHKTPHQRSGKTMKPPEQQRIRKTMKPPEGEYYETPRTAEKIYRLDRRGYAPPT